MNYKNRFSSLYLLLAVFLAFSTVTRTVLLIAALPNLEPGVMMLARIYGVGLFFDCVTFLYAAIPFVAYLVVVPDRAFNGRFLRYVIYLTFFAATYALLFGIAAEYLFFDEFGTRFNFIAVDYLIYTTEVVRNIRESYPVYWIFGGIFVVNIAIFIALKKYIDPSFGLSSTLRMRVKQGAAFAALPLFSLAFIDQSIADISPNNFAVELASNGIYNFVAAFRNSELDYGKFYVTGDDKEALIRLKGLLKEDNSRFVSDEPGRIDRVITNQGPEKRLNVVVIVEESLSAEYLGAFGCDKGITPNLDRLSANSLFFTNLYATGTRTVRGLEAITLSVPPLPGESIVKRPDNGNFFSWGSVMNSRGYDCKFIYAGHGFFDNMNSFYSANGFKTVDRLDFGKDEVRFENAWGVCDEDLFDKVIKEGDRSWDAKKPFFSVVMTTSNHRPYTYPEGRVDIPSHTGRDGAVKYSDYAIGYLIGKLDKEPWAKDTVLVIVADHCAGSARKVALPIKSYRIPMFVYSPGNINPARFDGMMSQLDIAPTVLGLLNFSYTSEFFGRDILKAGETRPRSFISTYQRLGFIEGDGLIILDPKKQTGAFECNFDDGSVVPSDGMGEELKDALAYYQGSNYIYKNRLNRLDSAK